MADLGDLEELFFFPPEREKRHQSPFLLPLHSLFDSLSSRSLFPLSYPLPRRSEGRQRSSSLLAYSSQLTRKE